MPEKVVPDQSGRVVEGATSLSHDASLPCLLPDGTAAFVVRRHEGFVAYENHCPHWGVDLDLGFGDFVDPRSGLIACRNHLAEFDPDTGLCVSGPCVGASLRRLDVVVEGDLVRVRRPA